MKRKLIAFDLDGTLAPSKSPLPDRMSPLISQLLEHYQVCVISGGKFEQFEKQLLNNLKADDKTLKNLHIMPTCGTCYMKFNQESGKWDQIYAENFTSDQKKQISDVLNKVLDDLGLRESKTYGDIIEDRGSQITLSALGQDIVDTLGAEGLKLKMDWDKDNKKKQAIRDQAAGLLPDFEVRVGGTTSVDITKPGIDKAYGINKLINMLSITKEEIFFIGDRLAEGGNDYPVKAMGVDCLEISAWEETALAIEAILAVS